MFAGHAGHFVHVDNLRIAGDAVGHRIEPFARHVNWRSVGQMPASREIKPHKRIARLKQREENRLIHLAP